MKNEFVPMDCLLEHFGNLAVTPVTPEELKAVRKQLATAAQLLESEKLAALERALREPRTRSIPKELPGGASEISFENGDIVGTTYEIDTEVETTAEAVMKLAAATVRSMISWIWEPFTCQDGMKMTDRKARECKSLVFINYTESRGWTREQIGMEVGLSRDKVIEVANDFAEKFSVLARASSANGDQPAKNFKAYQEQADEEARRHVKWLVDFNWEEMSKFFQTKEDGIKAVMNGEYSPVDYRRVTRA